MHSGTSFLRIHPQSHHQKLGRSKEHHRWMKLLGFGMFGDQGSPVANIVLFNQIGTWLPNPPKTIPKEIFPGTPPVRRGAERGRFQTQPVHSGVDFPWTSLPQRPGICLEAAVVVHPW